MPVITHETRESPRSQQVIYERERRSESDRRDSTPHDEKVTAGALTGGSSLELLGGGAAVVLAIIGLSGYLPMYMTAIATIAIGAALLAHGAAAAARWSDTVRRAQRTEQIEVGGGLGSEVFGGAAGITLGILALAGVMPFVLLAVAAIVLGGSILLAAPAQPQLAKLGQARGDRADNLTYEAVEVASGGMALAGIGGVVLGILALIHVGPAFTLVMIVMLAIGGALFLDGSALTARFARRMRYAS